MMAAAEDGLPLGQHASEVGVAPRLRSLRITEDSDSMHDGASSARGMTPTRSLEGSPMRLRSVSTESALMRAHLRSNGQNQWRKTVTVALGTVCLFVAAFFACSVYQRYAHRLPITTLPVSPSTTVANKALTKTVDSNQEELPTETDKDLPAKAEAVESDVSSNRKTLPEKAATKQSRVKKLGVEKLDVAKEVAKAVSYSSAKDSTAALAPEITDKHVKIFMAELQPKYNKLLLEAVISLINNGDAQGEGTARVAEAAESVISNPIGEALSDTSNEVWGGNAGNLDVLFYSQLLESPLLTKNWSDADFVFVPFWVHKLVKLDKELEKPNRHDLAMIDFWKEVDGLLPTLGKLPHVIVVPGKEAELRGTCGGHGLDFLCHPKAKHFTVLTPELLTGRASSLTASRVAPGVIGSINNNTNSVAVPDSASIHFSSPDTTTKFSAEQVLSAKSKLISEAFRARAPLRRTLRSQCLQHKEECVHIDPPALFHHAGSFTTTIWEGNKAAWYSLQPPGDTAMRTSFYDCLLASAIPVVFDNKLPQILPFLDVVTWEALLHIVSPDDILKSDKDVVELLKKAHSEQERLTKLAVLHTVRHLFQYSLSPAHQLARFDHLNTVTQQDDAFSMSLKSLMKHLCRSTLAPKRCKYAHK